jgi:hypothetical protein
LNVTKLSSGLGDAKIDQTSPCDLRVYYVFDRVYARNFVIMFAWTFDPKFVLCTWS